ncbi:hypothetical protein Trydic_g9694 [Trypoxylus dichotomus]
MAPFDKYIVTVITLLHGLLVLSSPTSVGNESEDFSINAQDTYHYLAEAPCSDGWKRVNGRCVRMFDKFVKGSSGPSRSDWTYTQTNWPSLVGPMPAQRPIPIPRVQQNLIAAPDFSYPRIQWSHPQIVRPYLPIGWLYPSGTTGLILSTNWGR